MDCIPKIFVINLPHRTDRLISITTELTRMGLLEKMEVVEGVVLIAHETGTAGIAEAHARCLELAKERGYEIIMILEDDCKFLVDRETFDKEIETFLKTAGDWNGLWFGSFVNNKHTKTEHNWVYGAGYNQDTAKLIHSRFYDQLINTYRLCRDKYIEIGEDKYNIDAMISETIPIYFTKKSLCGQADNYSDRVFQVMCGGIWKGL